MSRLGRTICAALVAFLPLETLADQTDSAVFDLQLKGIRAGQLTLNGKIEGRDYAVNGVLKSTGILAVIKKIRYDATAFGRYSDGRFTPARYQERADTGSRQSESLMDYRSGVPQVKVYNPPRDNKPGDVDPATQGGTVDPLTALYAAFRDVPEGEACTLRTFMFDGKRRSQVVLADPQKSDGKVTCAGEYRRLEGFSAKDMAKKTRFPFRLTYEPAGDGMLRVAHVSMDTLYGKGELKRR